MTYLNGWELIVTELFIFNLFRDTSFDSVYSGAKISLHFNHLRNHQRGVQRRSFANDPALFLPGRKKKCPKAEVPRPRDVRHGTRVCPLLPSPLHQQRSKSNRSLRRWYVQGWSEERRQQVRRQRRPLLPPTRCWTLFSRSRGSCSLPDFRRLPAFPHPGRAPLHRRLASFPRHWLVTWLRDRICLAEDKNWRRQADVGASGQQGTRKLWRLGKAVQDCIVPAKN